MQYAGQVIFLVLCVAVTGVVSVIVSAYIARCVRLVIEATAAGAKEVYWPKENFLDWLIPSLAFAALAFLVLPPVGIVTLILNEIWPGGSMVARTFLLAAPAVWLLFPIGALSSLSAGSRFAIFRPLIVTRMLQLAPATIAFYLLTGLVACLAIIPWFMAVSRSGILLLLVAAPLSGAMVLLYGRLLGQLAWRIARLGPLATERRRKSHWARKASDERMPSHIPLPAPTKSFEPWPETGSHVPQSPTGLLEEENLVPYEFGDDQRAALAKQAAEKRPERLRPLDPEEEAAKIPYEMAAPPSPNPALTTDMLIRTLPKSWEADRPEPGNAPPGVSPRELICFPFQRTNLSALVYSALGIGILGLLLMELISLIPPGY
jgi:hypothetical protein